MDRVRSLEMLVHAADGGSFARAAAALRVTPSAISHGVAELEQRLATPLFHRTTRRLRLTEEGEAAYRCGRELLERLQQLEELTSDRTPRPLRGTLRIGMGAGVGRSVVGPRLAGFLARHPALQVELLSQYQPSAMHLAGMDVLIRVEEIPDSSLIARRLGHIRHAVFASPQYLAAAGTPDEPDDLPRHRCLVYKPPQLARPADEWQFERGPDRHCVRVPTTAMSDDREVLVAMAVGGAGVIRIGMIDPALIDSGALIRLLPKWSLPDGPPLHALYRRTPHIPRKIAAFLEFMADALADFDPARAVFVSTPTTSAHPRQPD